MNVRLIQVYANTIAFNLKIRLSLYKIAVNYLLSLFFMFVFLHKIYFYFFCFRIHNSVYPKYYKRCNKYVRQ